MIKRLIYTLTIVALICSCANRGYPEGGPKDETAPQIVKEEPYSYSTDFKQNKLRIYFNEYIQVKDANSNLMVSPPLKKKPTVSNRGKYIVVDFSRDTLKENTTYNVDFGTSIVDNNESNPLGFYRYVFSTGPEIDTMEMGGQVIDAESGEPLLKVLVALYKNHADSAAVNELPSYVALTDSSGHFRFTNIQDTLYRLVAFEDASSDYIYLPESENVGFIDTLIKPVVYPAIRIDSTFKIIKDTIKEGVIVDTTVVDSIKEISYYAYGPADLSVRLFTEEKTQNYMESPKRTERENITTIFAMPQGGRELTLQLTDSLLRDSVGDKEWYSIERNLTYDSLTIWLTDSLVVKRDTLLIEFNYLKSDSLKQLVPTKDTIRLNYKPKEDTGKGKKKKELTAQDSIAMLYASAMVNKKSIEIGDNAYLLFETPINPAGLDSIRIEEKQDSTFIPISFSVEQDSVNLRKFWFKADYKSGKEYKMSLDTGVVATIYGKPIAGIENSFSVKKSTEYSNLKVNVINSHNRPVLIQMYSAKKASTSKKVATGAGQNSFNIVKSKSTNQDGVVVFELVNEGSYMLRTVIDSNGNGKWDTGRYLKHIQPEEVYYQYIEIPIKSNFDVEQDFDLDFQYSPPPVEEKEKEKK